MMQSFQNAPQYDLMIKFLIQVVLMSPRNNQFAFLQALEKNGRSFSGRPFSSLGNMVTQGHGIAAMDYGDYWKNQKKFGSMTFRR